MRVTLRVIPGNGPESGNSSPVSGQIEVPNRRPVGVPVSHSNPDGKSGNADGKSGNASRQPGINRLTDTQCRKAKPDAKPYKLSDGKGLYLLVRPNGSKLWQYAYEHQGKANVYSIGSLDDVSLAEARNERDKARGWLKAGLDPNIEKKADRARVAARQGDTFSALAEDWFATWKVKQSKGHVQARRRLLDNDLLKSIGAVPIADLEQSPPTALAALQRIEARGAYEIASKARIVGSMICRYGIVTGRIRNDPFAHLGQVLARPPVAHRATIPLGEMPALFEALGEVPAEANTKLAVYWLILTAVRTSEMRFATWAEIDAKAKLWRIPAARMKMRDPHMVPLSTQAQRVLELARPLRVNDDPAALIFPGFTKHGALSENALLALLARAGFFGRQTGHGFRASFSTWAHEVVEADPDVVEACLAHSRGDVRAIYNRATYVSKRRELLQAWADQLEAWGMKLP